MCIFASVVGVSEISGEVQKIKSVLCESRTLNNGELLSCCRLCLSEKQEASSASKLPVLQLCSPSSVRKEQIVRHVRETQRTTKLSLPVRKIL